jgi:hypothetical protein
MSGKANKSAEKLNHSYQLALRCAAFVRDGYRGASGV